MDVQIQLQGLAAAQLRRAAQHQAQTTATDIEDVGQAPGPLGLAAAIEAYRDVRLRYQTGLSDELDLSNTEDKLINALVSRLNATVGVNISYAQLLRELLPVPRDPSQPIQPQLQLDAAALPSR